MEVVTNKTECFHGGKNNETFIKHPERWAELDWRAIQCVHQAFISRQSGQEIPIYGREAGERIILSERRAPACPYRSPLGTSTFD